MPCLSQPLALCSYINTSALHCVELDPRIEVFFVTLVALKTRRVPALRLPYSSPARPRVYVYICTRGYVGMQHTAESAAAKRISFPGLHENARFPFNVNTGARSYVGARSIELETPAGRSHGKFGSTLFEKSPTAGERKSNLGFNDFRLI